MVVSMLRVAALLGLLACCLTLPTQARAAGACGTSGNWFDGYSVPAKVSRYGVSARIEFRNPDLCGDDVTGGSFSGAWSMIIAASATYPSNAAAQGWAQVGYIQLADGDGNGHCHCIAQFAQYTRKCKATLSCTGYPLRTRYNTENPTGSWTYRVRYEDDGVLHMVSHGVELYAMDYTPAGDWDSHWAGQFSGETGHKESDIVGTSGNKANFTELHTQNYDLSWQDVGSPNMSHLVPTIAQYQREKFSNANFNIWTYR